MSQCCFCASEFKTWKLDNSISFHVYSPLLPFVETPSHSQNEKKIIIKEWTERWTWWAGQKEQTDDATLDQPYTGPPPQCQHPLPRLHLSQKKQRKRDYRSHQVKQVCVWAEPCVRHLLTTYVRLWPDTLNPTPMNTLKFFPKLSPIYEANFIASNHFTFKWTYIYNMCFSVI